MSKAHATLNRRRWQATRRAVFEADSYRCRARGHPGRLECDHTVPLHKSPDQDLYDPAGCQALCRECHSAKTTAESGRPPVPGLAAWRALIDELRG